MPRLDSARQRGPEITLRGILIIVESGGTGGRTNAAEIFHSQKLGADFACTSTTSGLMDKWMLQAHSTHQVGQEKMLPEFFTLRNWAPILLVPQQPAVPWTNGCRRWIQRIK